MTAWGEYRRTGGVSAGPGCLWKSVEAQYLYNDSISLVI